MAGSEDETVCHWDLQGYKKGDANLAPLATYRGHSAVVGDVAWHNLQDSIFASVGDDRMMLVWDTRDKAASPRNRVVDAHSAEINSIVFSPANEHIVCTGSSDKVGCGLCWRVELRAGTEADHIYRSLQTIALWDLRYTKSRLHSLEAHTDEVLQLAWSPHHETM